MANPYLLIDNEILVELQPAKVAISMLKNDTIQLKKEK